MSKRGHGEGGIFKRSDGRWAGTISLGYEAGRRKRRTFYGKTQAEVRGKLRAAQRKVDDGLPLLSERLRLGEYLENWLEGTARLNVRPGTYYRYRQLLVNDVMPTLGHRPLIRVAPEDLQKLYGDKLASGLAPRTVGHIHRVLHKALADALRFGHVARNVGAAVRAPKVAAKEMRFLDPDEARAFLAAAEGEPLEALYVLAVTAGLRQGEILALKWQDVDLERGQLQVRRSVRQIPREGFIETEPKSAKSRRSIALTPRAVEALRSHRARQLEYRMSALVYEDNGLVFANQIGRHIDHRNLLRRSFHGVLGRAGVPPVRFHDLRHTCATLLLSEGVHPKIVQEMLGHSQIAVTLDLYSHVTPTMQADAARKMQAILGG